MTVILGRDTSAKMSTNFHANQYEQTFTPHRTQNWEVPKNVEGKYPDTNTGFTRIKANDRGHLLPNVPKERSSPWGNFVGTWDMPTQIPGNRVTNATARCEEAVIKGHKLKERGEVVINGSLKRCRTVDPLPVKMDAPDDTVPVGMICEPGWGMPPQGTSHQPCIQTETTHFDSNQPRGLSRRSQDGLMWPKAKSPACKSPVGNPQSPKPVTPMAVADIDVQRFAEKRISPIAPQGDKALIGGMKTPDADLQNRCDQPPTPGNRILGMKSPTNAVLDNSNPHAEAALIS